jgi:hypothetical protein
METLVIRFARKPAVSAIEGTHLPIKSAAFGA